MAEESRAYDADVVVVGSGVAGALIAHRLAEAGKSVIMLEAGPRMQRWQIVERFRNQANKMDFMGPYPASKAAPHPMLYGENADYLVQKGEQPYDAQYIRAVGGTTWHWAASAWRFLPSDFVLKSEYGVGRDWPIGYDDLEDYYFRAEVALGVWGPNDVDLGCRCRGTSGGSASASIPTALTWSPSRWRATAAPMMSARPAAATTTACLSARSVRCIPASSMSRRPNVPVPD